MNIASTTGATSLSHNGVEYTPNKHGLFDVPHEVGQELLKFPHWVEEHVRDSTKAAEKLASDLQPESLLARVTEAEATIEHLKTDYEGRISTLEKHLTELADEFKAKAEELASAAKSATTRARSAAAKAGAAATAAADAAAAAEAKKK